MTRLFEPAVAQKRQTGIVKSACADAGLSAMASHAINVDV